MSNEATQHVKPPKVTPVAKLTIGKAIQPSLEGVRMFADINATSGERTLNPQTSRVNREPLLRSQEKAKPRLDIEHVGCILVAVVESCERWDHSFCRGAWARRLCHCTPSSTRSTKSYMLQVCRSAVVPPVVTSSDASQGELLAKRTRGAIHKVEDIE